MIRRVLIPSLVLPLVVVVACGKEERNEPPPVTTVPARCPANPGFEGALAAAQSKLGPLAGEPLESRSTHVPVVTAASQLSRGDLYDRETATIVRDNPNFVELLKSAYAFETDPATEALLVVSYYHSETTLTLRREGAVAHVYLARTKPCLDDASAEAASRAAEEVMVAAVSADITSVELHTATESFAPALPPVTSDACARDGTVFSGGGRPGLLRGAPHTLFVEGFSAMTGNIFETTSTDGASWAPAGWDDKHLLTFDARGPYADVYSPSPIQLGATLFLYASTLPIAGVTRIPRIGRSARLDGVHFAAPEDVLLPATSGWSAGGVSAPSVLEHDGAVALYYAGVEAGSSLYRVGLARSTDGGKTFVPEGTGPVIGPETFSYGVSSISDPDVHVVGDHLEMWCTVWLSGGNPTARLSTAIAHLTSQDGRAWTADPTPVLVPRGDAERGGLLGSVALVEDDRITLFVSALNARDEPSVERLSCPKR